MSAYVDSTGVTYLTADIKALADETYPAIAAIADEYDSTSAYAVGDFCIKDGLFYKCNTAIATGGEAWNSAHWTVTNVADNLGTKMVILSYGHSTWNDYITAYKANAIVYCRASSGSDPGSGSQTRMAFMAYVNNADNPTEVEFQYYRSVSSHSVTQQGDQVYVYKLTSSNGGTWTVTTREASSKIVAGTGLSSSYSSGTLTLSASKTDLETLLELDEIYGVVISETEPTNTHVNGWIDPTTTVEEEIPQIDDTAVSSADTFSSSKINSTYLAFGVSQTLTESQMTQLYANMGFPSNTLGKLGYTVVT